MTWRELLEHLQHIDVVNTSLLDEEAHLNDPALNRKFHIDELQVVLEEDNEEEKLVINFFG